ncbi:MAG: hypothetical protein HQ582_25700 [Planctomycetes bacterium]|nr:hypothetical protein [Planctomycetota bacterium]
MRTNTYRVLAIVALIAVIAGIHLLAQREGHAWGGDFSIYIEHAQNLAEGVPYADTGYIYNPHYPAVGPPTYPPGGAMLLAGVYRVAGMDLVAMKGAMIGCFVVFLVMLTLCVRKELPPELLILLVALIGLNHYFVVETSYIGSDMPFLALLYLALWLIRSAYQPNVSARKQIALLAVAGVAAYLAFGTRTLGGLLIPALLAVDVLHWRRLRISPGAMLATGIFTVLAIVQSMFLHSDHHYFDQLGTGVTVLLHNGVSYAGRMAAFWDNGYYKPLAAVVFLLVFALAVFGYARSVRHKPGILEVFSVLYMVAVLLWPGFQGERYLYPVYPLVLYFALRGLQHGWVVHRPVVRRVAVASLLTAASVSYVAHFTSLDLGPVTVGPLTAKSVEMFDYIADKTDPDAVVVFVKPRVMSLYTSRDSSVYHHADDDQQLWDYFGQIGVTHVVVVKRDEVIGQAEDPALLEYLRGFVARNGERFTPVFANGDFTVVEVVRRTA